MRAVQREEHVGVRRVRSEQLDEPSSDRDLVRAHAEVAVAQHDALRPACGEDRRELGVGLAEHERRARLHDPGLLLGDPGPGRAEVLDVVELDVGDHGDLAVDHVGGVPAAPEAHLDDRDVDGHVGEPLQGGGVDDLEVARAVVEHQLDVGDAQEDAVEVVVGDGLAVPARCAR